MPTNADVRKKPGPKGLSDSEWNRIVDLIEKGKTNEEIKVATGRGLTKICEIRRNPVRKGRRAA